MSPAAYDLFLPVRPVPGLVVSSPHSGRDYPADFIAQSPLSAAVLRSSEDAFVDMLWADAPLHGAVLLAARAPRAYVDLNRAPDELDPALIEGVKKSGLNPRVTSGLGVIPRVVAAGRVIHPGRILRAEADRRLNDHWHPFHRTLTQLLWQARQQAGFSLLIDVHSMPHEAITPARGSDALPPEVVLGDRFGASCAPAIMQSVEDAFVRAGFRVRRNHPFAGAYIARSYGRPSAGQHAVQVELDRSLYMDEARIIPGPRFAEIRARLSTVAQDLCTLATALRSPGQALAAE